MRRGSRKLSFQSFGLKVKTLVGEGRCEIGCDHLNPFSTPFNVFGNPSTWYRQKHRRQRQKACLLRNRLCDFTSGHKTKRQQYENFIVLSGLEVELMALIRLTEKKVQGYQYYFKKLLSPAKRQQHVWGIGLNHLSSFLGTTIFWRIYDSQVCWPPHSING